VNLPLAATGNERRMQKEKARRFLFGPSLAVSVSLA
jgi:hypothetical protein